MMYLLFALIGGATGFLTTRLDRFTMDLVPSVLTGAVGGLIGATLVSWTLALLNWVFALLAAAVGAFVLVWVVQYLQARR